MYSKKKATFNPRLNKKLTLHPGVPVGSLNGILKLRKIIAERIEHQIRVGEDWRTNLRSAMQRDKLLSEAIPYEWVTLKDEEIISRLRNHGKKGKKTKK
jgi:hypothetical protein